MLILAVRELHSSPTFLLSSIFAPFLTSISISSHLLSSSISLSFRSFLFNYSPLSSPPSLFNPSFYLLLCFLSQVSFPRFPLLPSLLSPPCIKRQLYSLWLFPSKYCAYNSSSFCLEMGRSEVLSSLSRFLLFALPFWLKCLMSCVG